MISMELTTRANSVSLSTALTIARRLLVEAVNEQGGARAIAARSGQREGSVVVVGIVLLRHEQTQSRLVVEIGMGPDSTISEIVMRHEATTGNFLEN